MKQYQSKHTAALSTRGFYTILSLCALIIAASAWVIWGNAHRQNAVEPDTGMPIIAPTDSTAEAPTAPENPTTNAPSGGESSTTGTSAPDKKSGCASAVSLEGLSVILTVMLGAGIIKKKKD